MRTRLEIEKEPVYLPLLLEVLLDIRDLLKPQITMDDITQASRSEERATEGQK